MFPFEVDTTTDVPLWVQLRQRLIHLINTGYFKPGDQLPTVRGLASEISINYNTVNKAYLSLASDGYIESVRGRGAFVRNIEDEVWSEHASEVDGLIDDCIQACLDMGLSPDDVVALVSRKVSKLKRAGAAAPVDKAASRVIKLDMGAGDVPSAKTGA